MHFFFFFFGRDLARVRVASRCSYLDICLLSVGSEDFDSHPVVFLILSTSLPVVAWLWLVWDGGFWILCFYLPQLLVSLLSLIYLFLLVTQKVSCGYARYTGTLLYVFVGHFLWSHNFFGVISFSLECWILEIPPKIAGGPFVTPQIHGEKRWSTREASRMRHRWVMQRIDGIREDLWSIGPTMGTAWWRVTGTKGTRCKMAKLGDFSLWKIFASLGAWFCWEICCSV